MIKILKQVCFARLVKLFILPLLSIFFAAEAPIRHYEKKKCSSFEWQQEAAEECSSELCDESEAIAEAHVFLEEPGHSARFSTYLYIHCISENYTRGVHQPPESI